MGLLILYYVILYIIAYKAFELWLDIRDYWYFLYYDQRNGILSNGTSNIIVTILRIYDATLSEEMEGEKWQKNSTELDTLRQQRASCNTGVPRIQRTELFVCT